MSAMKTNRFTGERGKSCTFANKFDLIFCTNVFVLRQGSRRIDPVHL